MVLDDASCEGREEDGPCQKWCFSCGSLADTMILGKRF